MTKSLTISLAILTGLAFFGGGCKMVQTTFENTTSQPLELQLNGPGLNTGDLGTIPPGGQVRTKIEVCPIWLPTSYTWTAGQYNGSFAVTSDMKPKIWVAIPEGAPTADPQGRHAEGHRLTGDPTPVVYQP
jgi:hypothetical protein